MTWVVVAVAVAVLLAVYVSWTAGRLDRMHARVDAAWAALDAQLVRRAAAARALLPFLPPGDVARDLEAGTAAALSAGDRGRDVVENGLTKVLRTALPLVPPDALHVVAELEAASSRVGLARAFHNSAVMDTRALRRRRIPRYLKLAGHRDMPGFFDVEDTALRTEG